MIGSCPRDSELSCLKPHQLTSSHLDITVYNQSYEEYEDRYIQVISWPTRKIRPWEFGVPKMDLLQERWKKKQFREHLLAPRSDLNCPVRRETLSKRLRPKNPRVLYGVDILSSCHLVKCCPLHFPSNEKIWKKKTQQLHPISTFLSAWKYLWRQKTEDSHFILGAKGRFSGWSYLSRCLLMWRLKQNCQPKTSKDLTWKVLETQLERLVIHEIDSSEKLLKYVMLQIMLKLITFSRSNYVKPPHVTGLFRLGCLAHGFGLRARTPSRGRPPLSKLWLASCVLIYADLLVDFCDDFLLNSLSWANPRHVSGPYSRVFKTGMLVMPCWDRKSVEHCWALEEYGPEDWWFVTLWHPPLAMLWEWQRDEQHVENQCRFIYQCGKWYVMMRDKS